MRFAANLTLLFKEVPFVDRFSHARRAGFTGVEFMWPQGEDLDALVRAADEAAVEVVLFNFDAGDIAAGDRGLLSDPSRQGAFRENVPVALELASRLNCTRLNALVGVRQPGLDLTGQLELARENVAWAARRARRHGVTIMIEAINSVENGPYLLDTTQKAITFIESVAGENLKLQYDAYHMHRMGEDVAITLERYLPRIGHVQIADSPSRNEPGTGKIRFASLFDLLERNRYSGWVGLEYNPSTHRTRESLRWLAAFGYSGFGTPCSDDTRSRDGTSCSR